MRFSLSPVRRPVRIRPSEATARKKKVDTSGASGRRIKRLLKKAESPLPHGRGSVSSSRKDRDPIHFQQPLKVAQRAPQPAAAFQAASAKLGHGGCCGSGSRSELLSH